MHPEITSHVDAHLVVPYRKKFADTLSHFETLLCHFIIFLFLMDDFQFKEQKAISACEGRLWKSFADLMLSVVQIK
jgi:hypothetical protein